VGAGSLKFPKEKEEEGKRRIEIEKICSSQIKRPNRLKMT
jgi:hypothetical protein